MKIGILGSGDVAKALGHGFVARGDRVMLGTREPGKLDDWLRDHAGASAGSFAETATFGEVVALATLGTATVDAVGLAGPAAFAGKVVIDATNPLRVDEQGLHLTVGFSDSLGEQVQRALPGARVVKAFNTVGNALFYRPQFAGGPPTMFIAGDDPAAKATVDAILRDFGWESVDCGGIAASRYLEPLCPLWVGYAMRNKSMHHAFKLLR